MADLTPTESVRIPADLPETSADYNSLLTTVDEGASPTELDARLRARGGFARDEFSSRVKFNDAGAIVATDTIAGIRETRQVTPEQADVLRAVANQRSAAERVAARLNDAASLYRDIFANGASPTELDARLRARGGFARDEFNSRVKFNDAGEIVATGGISGIRETRQVTPEQADVLRAVTREAYEFRSSRAQLPAAASFLRDVFSGNVSPTELDARLRARGGFARDEFSSRVKFNDAGAIVATDTIAGIRETRQVTPEQAAIVRYVAAEANERVPRARAAGIVAYASQAVSVGLDARSATDRARLNGLDAVTTGDLVGLVNLRDAVSDRRVDAAVIELFSTGSDRTVLDLVDRRRAELAATSDTSVATADLNGLETYIQTARRLTLRSRFWEQATGDVNTALTELETYRLVDENDRVLVQELRNDALRLRRDSFLVGAFERLSQEQPDYQAAAFFVQAADMVVNTLQDDRGRAVVAETARAVYSSEISGYFVGLLGQLSEFERSSLNGVLAQLQDAPIRPEAAGVDYFKLFQAGKENFLRTITSIEGEVLNRDAATLRARFRGDRDIQGLVSDIVALPGETPEDSQLRQTLLDELALSVAARRGLDPGSFAALQDVASNGTRRRGGDTVTAVDLTETMPERNAGAVKNLVRRFQSSVMPLFEALRGGPGNEALVDRYVSGKTGDRAEYVQRIQALEEQRDLTDIERAYLQSVELLTVFNPHLVALLREQPELTSLYLEQYFAALDRQTKEALPADAYVPIMQIGLGPNGLAAAGELNRDNPDAAAQTLYIDAADWPGGPFGVPKGPSWELNSANSFSTSTNNLPDVLPQDEQGVSVRSHGSPLVAYPGERREGEDIRQASINVTVDYLPNPDNASTKRYPTNVDLARILQLQTAMLADNVMLGTRIIDTEYVDPEGAEAAYREAVAAGMAAPDMMDPRLIKRATLQYQTALGETITTTVRTSSIVVSSGLGDPNYGINLEGSQAERILEADSETPDRFPRLTDTIGAFSALSDPEGEPVAPDGTLVIYGGGNSADVLIEYFGRQFESGNPNLNGIQKVVVVTNSELSRRPRYAQINDLKARNGQNNFLEIVNARVTDVAEGTDGKLRLIGDDGQPITIGRNGGTQILEANHVVAAAGFRPMLDQVFGKLLRSGESLDRRRGLGGVSLPSNPGFTIADELLGDPGVVIVGTGSRADFQNTNKLAQLPDLARRALLRNGAENAVAIGFRTPDTRAAIRLKFSGREFPAATVERKSEVRKIDVTRPGAASGLTVPRVDQARRPQIRRNVDVDADTLSALFLRTLPKFQLTDGDGRPVSKTLLRDQAGRPLPVSEGDATYTYRINFDEATESFSVTPIADDGSNASVAVGPADLEVAITESMSDPYVQSYFIKALRGRRRNRGIVASLAFHRGHLRYRDPGEASGKERTYVEAL